VVKENQSINFSAKMLVNAVKGNKEDRIITRCWINLTENEVIRIVLKMLQKGILW